MQWANQLPVHFERLKPELKEQILADLQGMSFSQQQRITLIGPFQSGKTTLADILAQVSGVAVVREIAEDLLNTNELVPEDPAFQSLLLDAQKAREAHATLQGGQYLVTDRGYIDIIAYSRFYNVDVPADLIRLAHTYDKVYFCDSFGFKTADSLWPEARRMRASLAECYWNVINEMGINVIVLRGSPIERLVTIASTLPRIGASPEIQSNILHAGLLNLAIMDNKSARQELMCRRQEEGRRRTLTSPETDELMFALKEASMIGRPGLVSTLVRSDWPRRQSAALDYLRGMSFTVGDYVVHVPNDWKLVRQDDISAVIGVLRKDGQILAIRNARGWDLPGGHVEENESELEALARESNEEGSVTISHAVPILTLTTSSGHYAGKKMILYLAEIEELLPFSPASDSFERRLMSIDEFARLYISEPESCREFLFGHLASA